MVTEWTSRDIRISKNLDVVCQDASDHKDYSFFCSRIFQGFSSLLFPPWHPSNMLFFTWLDVKVLFLHVEFYSATVGPIYSEQIAQCKQNFDPWINYRSCKRFLEKQCASLEKPCYSVSRKESFQSTIMFNLLRLKTSSLVCFGDWDMLDLLPNQDAIVANYGVFAWDSLLTL